MQLLNGKAKELFDEWRMTDKALETYGTVYFYDLPKELQCTMIIEWFDSVGITVDVMPILDEKVKFQPNTFWLEKEIITEEIEYFESRQEATTEAIKKAVELINESNGK